MKLSGEGDITTFGATELDIIEAFADDERRGSFVILDQSDEAGTNEFYIQSSGEGDGPYDLEYRMGSGDQHFRCINDVSKSQVQEAFVKYLKGDDSWQTDFEWEKLEPGKWNGGNKSCKMEEQEKGTPIKMSNLIIVVVIFCALVAFFLYPAFQIMDPGDITWLVVKSRCKEIGHNFLMYMQDCNDNSKAIDKRGFVNFLIDEHIERTSGYLEEEPFEPYRYKYDFGVCFYLPENLESKNNLLIGHTPLIKSTRFDFGIVFVFDINEVKVEVLREEELNNFVGEERLKNLKPDFYFWRNMQKYLNDKEREIEDDVNSVESRELKG